MMHEVDAPTAVIRVVHIHRLQQLEDHRGVPRRLILASRTAQAALYTNGSPRQLNHEPDSDPRKLGCRKCA
jgi:hypothetical protein